MAIACRSTAYEIACRNSRWNSHGACDEAWRLAVRLNHRKSGSRPVAGVDQPDRAAIGERLEPRVILRTDVAVGHEIDLAGLQAQRLSALVADDRQRQRVEVRQLHAGGIATEVAGIALEHQPLPGHVFGQHERAEADDVGDRRGGGPGAVEAAGGQRRFERVPGQDRQAVQQPQPRRKAGRKLEDDRRRIRRAGLDRFALDHERLAQRALDRRVVGRLQREQHVRGGERHAVGKRDAGPERERVGQSVRRRAPLLGQERFDLVGRAIDPHQPRLREHRHVVGRGADAGRCEAVVQTWAPSAPMRPAILRARSPAHSRSPERRRWSRRARGEA